MREKIVLYCKENLGLNIPIKIFETDDQGVSMRVGLGYDVHRLVDGRKLILGGETIPFEKGLLGHSDADVLVHAVCDSLLGAAGLGDIGHHFPDTSPEYKDADSMDLLRKCRTMINEIGLYPINLDATVFAEAPKLAAYKTKMEKNLSDALKVDPQRINIKATTTEGLGPVGRGEGIAAMCVVLIESRNLHGVSPAKDGL